MATLAERTLHRLREARFNHAARAVLDTAPVTPCDDGLILFSMIGTRVLIPYLIAAKSLRASLGGGRFVVLDDGTLTASDRAAIRAHLGDPQVLAISAVDTGPCPRGGTWERLLTILDLRRDHYVIQFDSDTVSLDTMPEVRTAVAAGRSFTLRGEKSAELLPLTEVSRRARATVAAGRVHVQSAIERAMEGLTIQGRPDLRYVRGCSGFAGFAPSVEGRMLAEQFSAAAEGLVGKAKWAEWGSEQVCSNFVIANQGDALLLPYERYLNYWNEPYPADAALVHFVGTYRFRRGAYLAAARRVIAQVERPEPAAQDPAPEPRLDAVA